MRVNVHYGMKKYTLKWYLQKPIKQKIKKKKQEKKHLQFFMGQVDSSNSQNMNNSNVT